MTRAELFEEYIKKVCHYCKGECDRGITILQDQHGIVVKCVDYEKDKSKIVGYKKPLTRTAKLEKCIMPKLWREC